MCIRASSHLVRLDLQVELVRGKVLSCWKIGRPDSPLIFSLFASDSHYGFDVPASTSVFRSRISHSHQGQRACSIQPCSAVSSCIEARTSYFQRALLLLLFFSVRRRPLEPGLSRSSWFKFKTLEAKNVLVQGTVVMGVGQYTAAKKDSTVQTNAKRFSRFASSATTLRARDVPLDGPRRPCWEETLSRILTAS